LLRTKILLIPIILGLILVSYSWLQSYPLTLQSGADLLYNHISVYYWVGFTLIISSLYLFCLIVKSDFIRWVLTIGIILTFFSIFYFFYQLPGSDCTVFTGLSKYAIATQQLDTSQSNHLYFQWPIFFISAQLGVTITGLSLATFQYLQYSLIGILLTTSLFLYIPKPLRKNAPTAVIAFFILAFYFINYQDVPFSLALAILFVMLALESRPKNFGTEIFNILLFACLALTHAFVPLFFVLFLFIKMLIRKNKQYALLFMSTIIIYLVVQFLTANSSFFSNIQMLSASPNDYQTVIEATTKTVSFTPFQIYLQTFSRAVVVGFGLICLIGFIILFVKRKLRSSDKALFLTGLGYFAIGFVLSVLGNRAIPLIIIPMTIGIVYLLSTKVKKFLKIGLLVLMIFSVSIPLHTTLGNPPVLFQTNEELHTADFLIVNHDWDHFSSVFAETGTRWYIFPLVNMTETQLDDQVSQGFSFSNISYYGTVLYDVRLEQTNPELIANHSLVNLSNYNIIYDSDYSFIAQKAGE
jgi:hypothetical protein